jgi:hypothetical protein
MKDGMADFDIHSFPTRRHILKTAGVYSVLSAFGLHWMPWGQPEGSIMDQLSCYMARAAAHPLPSDVQEQVKNHVLDTFAAVISGSRLPPGRAAVRFLLANPSGGMQRLQLALFCAIPWKRLWSMAFWPTPTSRTIPMHPHNHIRVVPLCQLRLQLIHEVLGLENLKSIKNLRPLLQGA